MARKPDPKPRELPMDIVAGNIAGLMQRRRITPLEICKLLGYAQTRTWNTRMSDPSSFTGGGSEYDMFIFRRDVGAACT